MAGIGTVTYYDPATGDFGALGHGITDTDTALLMPFSSGSVLPSTVKAVKKGTAGSAGELRGDFDLTQDIGTLSANTTSGIFGTGTDVSGGLEQQPGASCCLCIGDSGRTCPDPLQCGRGYGTQLRH